MNRKSGAFSLPWIEARQDRLAIDGIYALVLGLLAFVLALVVILLILFLAKPEIPPAIADGVGVSSARWSVLSQFCSSNDMGSGESGVAQAIELEDPVPAAWR